MLHKNGTMEFHLFHYPTHTVEWMIMYGESVSCDGDLDAADGQGRLVAWCSYHLTAENAQESVMGTVEGFGGLYEHVKVIEHNPAR